jgi:ribosomal-protein-alanine N-acetyltransferase
MNLLEIETARLRLRPFNMDDVDDLHRLWTNPEVRKYLWDDIIISREQAEEAVHGSNASFAAHGFGSWVVFPKEKEELIGFCGFRFFGGPPEVELLYGLYPQYWRQGLATEMAKAMLRCGFEEHGLDRIWAGADPPNAASFRVMERIGMKFAKRTYVNDREAIYYVILQEQFQPDDAVYILKRENL